MRMISSGVIKGSVGFPGSPNHERAQVLGVTVTPTGTPAAAASSIWTWVRERSRMSAALTTAHAVPPVRASAGRDSGSGA